MKALVSGVVVLISLGTALTAQELGTRVRELETASDPSGAKSLLEQAVREQPENGAYLAEYARFLDRRGDPEARSVYANALKAAPASDSETRSTMARRLVILDLLAGDNVSAGEHLEEYRKTGGARLSSAAMPQPSTEAAATEYIEIPGPLGSFSRMIAIAPGAKPETILPAVARNVVTNGYQASASYEGLQPTEYLKLANRYLSQARELEKLSDESKTIRIETCESPKTKDLLRVLGYRMRGGCGGEVILETVNATRAFLTIDSGFPLAELEQSLRTSRPFLYSYEPSKVPILYGPDYWLSARDKKRNESAIDAFMGDPALCRLYLGLSKLNPDTAAALRQAADVQQLKAFAHVMDFFGSLFEVRDGQAIIPGGERTTAIWEELVGEPPSRGGDFFFRLLARDDGWMASYFDSLMRIEGPVKEHLTEPGRMKRFYMAIRGKVTSPGPARPVFRSNADLMLLITRMRLEDNGQPHIPGGIEIWKRLFVDSPDKEYDKNLSKLAMQWDDPDDVIEALFALCRKPVGNTPLKIYLATADINRRRSQPLTPATVDRLARAYHELGDQYTLFTESGSISDQTIVAFLDKIDQIEEIGNKTRRANTAGSMQALTGLWQIFVRNGGIPEGQADSTLAAVIDRFGEMDNEVELYDASASGMKTLLAATETTEGLSLQDRVIDLLAGASSPRDAESHQLVIQDLIRFFEAQKLVPLDHVFELANHLESLAGGNAQLDTALVNRIATRLEEIHLPREGLSSVERTSLSFGYWPERHIQSQRKLKLRSDIRAAMGRPNDLREIRGELSGVLRDTLVGFNYLHYAPPGAQVLRTNPLFVRGHDFLGMAGTNHTWETAEVFGTGWPSSAGGRLVGSLAGLPYALAEAEQNFLIPEKEQALIWSDLVPQMILNAKIPRWWNVTASQMHWLALHQRYGHSALAEAVVLPEYRQKVLGHLSRQATPARVKKVEQNLAVGDVATALEYVTPSELFVLASTLLKEDPVDDVLAAEIRRLEAADPEGVNHEAISRAFGSPKPTLANSYRPELLHMRTFPTLMGYSSRIMAESWESNLLYFAALADELHLRPSQLNVYVPEWTQKTVEAIFATHLEDWPAVLRSLRSVGEDIRADFRQRIPGTQQASR